MLPKDHAEALFMGLLNTVLHHDRLMAEDPDVPQASRFSVLAETTARTIITVKLSSDVPFETLVYEWITHMLDGLADGSIKAEPFKPQDRTN